MWEQLQKFLATQPRGGSLPFADVSAMLRKNGPITRISRLEQKRYIKIWYIYVYIVSLDVYIDLTFKLLSFRSSAVSR